MNTDTPNPEILREYDIRGTFGKNLFKTDAHWLGEKFGSFVYQQGGRNITVCRDGRLSSPLLQEELIPALVSAGLNVVDIGIGPTPMSYFSGYYLKADATLMITGSHNPAQDNGIKITWNNRPFFAQSIQNLITQPFVKRNGGSITQNTSVLNAYVERLIQAHHFQKSLKIAWDTGNGAAGSVVEALAHALPMHQHTLLFTEIDGAFPNHHPDPSIPKNVETLRQTILSKGLDIGFAFDGDGDRVAVVDSKGRILTGEQLVIVLSKEVLQDVPGATILADVKCSQHVFNSIRTWGGNPIMVRTGHAWIKEVMHEKNAPFAGEMSGHMFFKHNYYGFDDGLYAAVYLLNSIQKIPGGLTALFDTLPIIHATPEYRIPCKEDEKASIIQSLQQKLKSTKRTFLTLDGVRVETNRGWWLVRTSNTQSVLIVRAEGKTSADIPYLLNEIKNFGINLPETVE